MKYCYPFIALLLLFFACTPLGVVRLAPPADAEIDRYLYGNPILRQASGGIAVNVNFYDASREYLVFDLEIENNGTEAFNYDPATTSLTATEGTPVPAIDPEIHLLSLDLQSIERERSRRVLGWVGGVALVATTAYAVAEGGGGNGGGEPDAITAGDIALSVVEGAAYAASSYGVARSAVAAPDAVPELNDRQFWLDYSLRLTTIRPGERAVGKVIFPRDDAATGFTLTVRIVGQEYTFPFDQRVLQPGS